MKEHQRLRHRRSTRKYNLRKSHEAAVIDGTIDRKFTLEFLLSLQNPEIESETEIRRLTKRAVNAARQRQ